MDKILEPLVEKAVGELAAKGADCEAVILYCERLAETAYQAGRDAEQDRLLSEAGARYLLALQKLVRDQADMEIIAAALRLVLDTHYFGATTMPNYVEKTD